MDRVPEEDCTSKCDYGTDPNIKCGKFNRYAVYKVAKFEFDDSTKYNSFMHNYPAGTSTKNIRHFAQIINSGIF